MSPRNIIPNPPVSSASVTRRSGQCELFMSSTPMAMSITQSQAMYTWASTNRASSSSLAAAAGLITKNQKKVPKPSTRISESSSSRPQDARSELARTATVNPVNRTGKNAR